MVEKLQKMIKEEKPIRSYTKKQSKRRGGVENNLDSLRLKIGGDIDDLERPLFITQLFRSSKLPPARRAYFEKEKDIRKHNLRHGLVVSHRLTSNNRPPNTERGPGLILGDKRLQNLEERFSEMSKKIYSLERIYGKRNVAHNPTLRINQPTFYLEEYSNN